MISFLRGRLAEKGQGQVVVEVGGVGVEVRVAGSALALLPPIGETVTLHTHLSVREDGFALYGFPRRRERELFQALLGVSGVGPRLALAVVAGCEPSRFWQAVRQADPALLAGIPGLGKKTVSRLLVELRDKVPSWVEEEGRDAAGDGPSPLLLEEARRQAQEALLALGYTAREASEAVAVAWREAGAGASVDEVILRALRGLSK